MLELLAIIILLPFALVIVIMAWPIIWRLGVFAICAAFVIAVLGGTLLLALGS